MPDRQATLYNKNNEIIASGKQYWWDLWGLDKNNFDGAIWRVEVRAGKGELDQWNLKRFKGFEEKAGDVMISILKAIRYTEPLNDDKNRSRWPMHPIWEASIEAAKTALTPYCCGASRGKIITDCRQEIINRYRKIFVGLSIGYTAAQGRSLSKIGAVIDEIHAEIDTNAKENRGSFIKKFERASGRFRLLNDIQ